MTAVQVELKLVEALLLKKGVTPNRKHIQSMPHTLWLVQTALDQSTPEIMAFQILGFAQRAILGFGVFTTNEVIAACPSMKDLM